MGSAVEAAVSTFASDGPWSACRRMGRSLSVVVVLVFFAMHPALGQSPLDCGAALSE
jgi:hypothetical protein